MSITKSFSTETSERYASALYELAGEKSEIKNIEKDVNAMFSLYNSSEDIRTFIQNPTKSIDLQIQMINKISEILEFSKTFKNLEWCAFWMFGVVLFFGIKIRHQHQAQAQ